MGTVWISIAGKPPRPHNFETAVAQAAFLRGASAAAAEAGVAYQQYDTEPDGANPNKTYNISVEATFHFRVDAPDDLAARRQAAAHLREIRDHESDLDLFDDNGCILGSIEINDTLDGTFALRQEGDPHGQR